ncbi:NYN domain-containing protein [Neisseriaceae bacterium B1]
MTTQNKKLAVLIDADNAPADCIDAMLEEIAKYGTATVKRIYGDWSHGLSKWKAALLPHAIIPVQQFAYTKGKNATDMALVIDAMDLLYSNNFDGFCLVSSDSDFTRLASRIRESGLTVYGFGEKKTPESFRKACDKFTYIEIFRPQKTQNQPKNSKNKPKSPENNEPTNQVGDLTQLIKRAVKETADDLGWANLGPIGSYISKVSPDFDSRLYGFGKLSDLIKSLDLFEHRTDNNQLQVRHRKADDNKKPNKNKTIEAKPTQLENNANLSGSLKKAPLTNPQTIAPHLENTPKKRGRKPKNAVQTVSGSQNETAVVTLETVISETQTATTETGKKRGRKPKNANASQPEKTANTQPEKLTEASNLSVSQDNGNNKPKRNRVPFTKLIPLVQQAIAATADQDGWASLTSAAKHLDTLINPLEHGYADARDIIHQVYAEWVETKKAGRGERVRNQKMFSVK